MLVGLQIRINLGDGNRAIPNKVTCFDPVIPLLEFILHIDLPAHLWNAIYARLFITVLSVVAKLGPLIDLMVNFICQLDWATGCRYLAKCYSGYSCDGVSVFCVLCFFYVLIYLFLKIFYCSIVDLQCCVSFCCTAKWISYTYTYIHSFLDSIPI